MNQKVLALAGCIAATAPSVTLADVLPENLVGLNLGEIRANSFLNQPFKGVIPFLFTSYENSKNLSIKLAPQSIFNKIGAEKSPILNSLNFQVIQQNNKPVILISSDKPISSPFLNFVLEIKDSDTTVYQDYTVLLDPESKQQAVVTDSKYVDFNRETKNNLEINELYKSYKSVVVSNKKTSSSQKQTLKESGALLLASLSSTNAASSNQKLRYQVKSGDSLSRIAQKNKSIDASLKTVSVLIFQKNPKAFIRGNVNRLKKGAILDLPTLAEINGFQIAKSKSKTKDVTKKSRIVSKKANATIVKKSVVKVEKAPTNSYIVLKGDSLSKITKKFTTEGVSFTKMMNTIFSNNPTAFINKSKNKLKVGASLKIPQLETLIAATEKSKARIEAKNSNIKSKSYVSKKIAKVDVDNASKTTDAKTTEKNTSLQPNQYQIRNGDTLSFITQKIGYKEVPFAEMLKAIYLNNPDAFIDGKITNLYVGSIITLPPLNTLQKLSDKTTSLVNKTSSSKVQKIKPSKTISVKKDKVVSIDLTKRIRELRKELSQAKDSLSNLQSNLSNKELLLEQKNIQLKSLNTMLAKYDEGVDSHSFVAVPVKINTEKTAIEQEYKPKSKAEMAKLKRDNLERSKKTQKQIDKIKALKNKISEPTKSFSIDESEGLFKNYKASNILSLSNTNYAYLTIALLLGLLLIRYRRELYSYTYSKIKYDQPKYYPVPEAGKYDLTEKNINFNDSKMDQDPGFYDSIKDNKTEDSVTIDSHLVEATEEIFELDEEAQQIAHCEHLVTELFDDADESLNNSEWDDIEKVCDNYIEKIKDAELNTMADNNSAIVEEATDFNHMMTDLLESLDKVDKSVKKNSLLENNFPDVVNVPKLKDTDHHNHI